MAQYASAGTIDIGNRETVLEAIKQASEIQESVVESLAGRPLLEVRESPPVNR